MRIHHTNRNELAALTSDSHRPWLAAACNRLLLLPDYPRSRILFAVDGGLTRAVLGLELKWGAEGRLMCATIGVLEEDPDHDNRGVGARLVRFAEDIAHINGCERLCAAPGLERWNGGRCRLAFSRRIIGRGWPKETTPRTQRGCA